MGMLDWFRSIVKGEDKSIAQPPATAGGGEDKGAEVAGLNFKTAVDAHMKWKVRLESYISGTSTEQLKVEVVSRKAGAERTCAFATATMRAMDLPAGFR